MSDDLRLFLSLSGMGLVLFSLMLPYDFVRGLIDGTGVGLTIGALAWSYCAWRRIP